MAAVVTNQDYIEILSNVYHVGAFAKYKYAALVGLMGDLGYSCRRDGQWWRFEQAGSTTISIAVGPGKKVDVAQHRRFAKEFKETFGMNKGVWGL